VTSTARSDATETASTPRASISAQVTASPTPTTSADLYLDLLKRTLTRVIVARGQERQTINPGRSWLRVGNQLVQRALRPLGLEIVRLIRTSPRDYVESGHAALNRAEDAETMLGILQLDQMQACIRDVVQRGTPGDLLEAGVWRGGMTIFMRAALQAYGDSTRRVWVADSFAGLPMPTDGSDSFGWRRGDMAVSLDEVRNNFARYGVLDDRVHFLKGFFSDTLPSAPIERLAVLRIDADLYDSTRDVLSALYPRVSRGGYVVIDDYSNLVDCRRAVDEYRDANGITESIVRIDTRAVYWQRA